MELLRDHIVTLCKHELCTILSTLRIGRSNDCSAIHYFMLRGRYGFR